MIQYLSQDKAISLSVGEDLRAVARGAVQAVIETAEVMAL